MKMNKVVAAAIMIVGLAAAAQPAHAKMTKGNPFMNFIRDLVSEPAPVLKSFTGSVTITKADKTVVTLKAGDPIPDLAPGDSINVVSGDAVVAVGHNEVTAKTGANVSIADSSFKVTSGDSTYSGSPLRSGVDISAKANLADYIAPPNSPGPQTFANPAPPTQQKSVVSPSAPF